MNRQLDSLDHGENDAVSKQADDTPPTKPEIRIRVDGRGIDDSDIDREAQYHNAPSLDEARRLAAQALVIRELLLAEAVAQGISDDTDNDTQSEARIRVLIERNIDVPDPTEPDCRRYYDANPARMRTADRHEVSHILIPSPPDDAELRALARNLAVELTGELRAESRQFAEIARKHSRCPSKEAGGYLGMIERGQTAPEFEKVLSRLPVGEVPEHPVETRFGFHIVLIHERHAGNPLTFAACHEKIADYLREHVRRRAISQYIRLLAAEHDIEGFDLDAANSPLVQ
ncbi:MAG TPA: peptidylprolyl isomerase [Woeseiaceae bacterium]|nr:peptidylprolyl isomerase [Woeseiaceae bacterium]